MNERTTDGRQQQSTKQLTIISSYLVLTRENQHMKREKRRSHIVPSRKRRRLSGTDKKEKNLEFEEIYADGLNASTSVTDDGFTSESRNGTHSNASRRSQSGTDKDIFGFQSSNSEASIRIELTSENLPTTPENPLDERIEQLEDDTTDEAELDKTIESFINIEINGEKVTDKNSIDFIRVCFKSYSQIIKPAKDVVLSRRTVQSFLSTLHRYGFIQHFKFNGKTLRPRVKNKVISEDKVLLSTVTFNLDLMCKDMDKFVDAINKFYWTRYYLVPKNIGELPLEFRVCYNQYLIETIKRLHKAMSDNDWRYIGQIIGEIDIDITVAAGNNSFYASKMIFTTYALLWENLFFISYQRILFHDIPHRIKAVLLEQLLMRFNELVRTEIYKIRKLLPLFIISVLVFGVAHDNLESIAAVLKIKIDARFNDPELNENLRVYQFYAEYLKLFKDPHARSNALYENLLDSIFDFLQNTQKKDVSLLLILEPFIILADKMEQIDRALESLIISCQKAPAIVPFVASILNRCGLSNLIGKLVSECLEHDSNSTFLHRFSLVTHYIEQRTLQMAAQGTFRYEEAEKHVRMFFNFFDYGKNRNNGLTWASFKLNLLLLAPFPEWVYEEWEERADWWPRFHDIPLESHHEDRKAVFQMFHKNAKAKKL